MTFDPAFRKTLLLIILALGFTLRVTALDTYGLSEDEVAKFRAIESYRHGEFSANGEHPMLMKLAIWGALDARDLAASAGIDVPVESALRLPNVIAGTVTIAAVAGATTYLFSPAVGLLSAVLVAVDPNVIAVNRLGKEDSFLVLFFFVAVWCYERAKSIGERDVRRAHAWYTLAGAAFGLMLASKYLPHLLGLYALFNVLYRKAAGLNAPRKRHYYSAMAGAFLMANFAVLLPSTWRYCLEYVQGRYLTHHGFFFDGRLYVTSAPVSLAGGAGAYYLEMIATKVSLPVLLAAGIGLIPLLRRRRERGFLWLNVLLFVQLFGYSLAAAKFQRYGLSLLVLVDILAAVGVLTVVQWMADLRLSPVMRRAAVAAAALLVIAGPLGASLMAKPFYSLNQNALGARLAPPAAIFPEEAYDFGVREAVNDIARHAPVRADIISDATGVVAHYLAHAGRSDLRVVSLSKSGVGTHGDRWVLVQDGHIYVENASMVAQIRHSHVAWREYCARSTPVLQVYHLPAHPPGVRAATRRRHRAAGVS